MLPTCVQVIRFKVQDGHPEWRIRIKREKAHTWCQRDIWWDTGKKTWRVTA